MTLQVSTAFANALVGKSKSVSDILAGGSLIVYSGSVPAGPSTALTSQTALATFTLSALASWAATGSSGSETIPFSATTVTASASGTATFFRFLASSDTTTGQIQGNITGDGVTITNTSIASGDNVTVTGTPTISMPNA